MESELKIFDRYCVLVLKDTALRMSMTIDFRFKMTGIIKNHSPNLILDCTGVRAMDSSFIASVFAAGNECKASNGRLIVVTESPQLRKLLLIGGEHQPVSLADDVETAAAELA